MSTIITLIAAFVKAAFVKTEKVDFSVFAEKALVSLKALFAAIPELSFVPADTETTKEKGAKTVSHNSPARLYVRAKHSKIPNVPLVCKPLFDDNKTILYGYVVLPDSTRVRSLDELESFCKIFMADEIGKHEDFEKLSVACTARQIGEDLANNKRQYLIRKLESADTLSKMAAPILAMPKALIPAVLEGLLLNKANVPLVEYIKEQFAESQS